MLLKIETHSERVLLFFGEKNPGLFVRRAVVRGATVVAATVAAGGSTAGAAAPVGCVVFSVQFDGATRDDAAISGVTCSAV